MESSPVHGEGIGASLDTSVDVLYWRCIEYYSLPEGKQAPVHSLAIISARTTDNMRSRQAEAQDNYLSDAISRFRVFLIPSRFCRRRRSEGFS
jgi:hypothetical protein